MRSTSLFIAPRSSQLLSKQRRLTPSVRFWDVYRGFWSPFHIFLSCLEGVCWLASSVQCSHTGLRSDHAHASHSSSDRVQRAEIPGFLKCDVWQGLFLHWSNRLQSHLVNSLKETKAVVRNTQGATSQRGAL